MFLRNKKPLIILIGYQKRVGKDTSAKYLKKLFEADEKKVKVVSFASPLKAIVAEMLGCSLSDLEQMKNDEDRVSSVYIDTSVRKILQNFGNGLMKYYFGSDVWAKLAFKDVEKYDVIIIPDFRFKQEYKTAKLVSDNVYTVHINRNTKYNDIDISEQELNYFIFDFVVNNNKNLNNLHTQLCKIYREINR